MLKVKVHSGPKLRLTLPVPYSLIGLGISFVGSKRLWNLIEKYASHTISAESKFLPSNPLILKRTLRQLLKEIRSYKGLTLVEVRSKDGTFIRIKL